MKVENTHQKMVLIVLADCHNAESGRCDPSIEFIAEKSFMSRRTVERALVRLEELGLVTRKGRVDQKGMKTSNSYRLNIDASESRIDASHSRNRCVRESVSDASESRINQESIKPGIEPRERTRVCPPDFVPSEYFLRTARIAPGVDVDAELFKFKNHEFNQAKSDWDRAFVKWLASATPTRATDPTDKHKTLMDELR